MYPAISTSDLLNIPITLPASKALRSQLGSQVKASRQAHRDAQRLLEEAKTQVEG
jgi:type I restriction enzyme M protein